MMYSIFTETKALAAVQKWIQVARSDAKQRSETMQEAVSYLGDDGSPNPNPNPQTRLVFLFYVDEC